MGPVGLRPVVLDSVALDAWETLLDLMQNFAGFLSCYSLFCFFKSKLAVYFNVFSKEKKDCR